MSPNDLLAVFDFDRTLADADSDASVIELLSARQPPPEFETGATDWTPYMQDIFGLIHAAGFTKEDILERIGGMRPVAGAAQLVGKLADAGWDIILLTDSNSVFVRHWLKVYELEDRITAVLTNPARWSRSGRLHVSPHSHQTSCSSCPSNLCKGLALRLYREGRATPYTRLLYVGDGFNDACPMATLGAQDLVCPRVGYPCEAVLRRRPPLTAQTLPWSDHYDILHHLFPDTPTHIDTQ